MRRIRKPKGLVGFALNDSSSILNFHRPDQEKASKPLHYTACGLDNVILLNGFERHETSYGSGVSIHDLEGLHKEIGLSLIQKDEPLTGKELRFLRNYLQETQASFAKKLNSEEQNLGRYERGDSDIPGPVDKLVRAYFFIAICTDEELEQLYKLLTREQSRGQSDRQHVFEQKNDGWHSRFVYVPGLSLDKRAPPAPVCND